MHVSKWSINWKMHSICYNKSFIDLNNYLFECIYLFYIKWCNKFKVVVYLILEADKFNFNKALVISNKLNFY